MQRPTRFSNWIYSTAFFLVITTGSNCQAQEILAEINILFSLGSATLTPTARASLSTLASKAVNEGASRVEVVGHTDSLDDPEYNLDLSRRRAETVATRLKQNGVGSNVLHVDWKGEFDPQTPSMEPADPKNRRVNVRVLR